MVKTNQDIHGWQCIRNDDGVLSVSNEKLLNTKFALDRNSLSQSDTVSSVAHLIDKGMVRKSISIMKRNGMAARSLGLNS